MTKKLWVAMIATFLIGIFALAVQPTAANTSQVDQQVVVQSANTGSQTMFAFNSWTGILIVIVFTLTAFLVYLIMSRHKKLKNPV